MSARPAAVAEAAHPLPDVAAEAYLLAMVVALHTQGVLLGQLPAEQPAATSATRWAAERLSAQLSA